jgi:hypothetical protein
MSRSTRNGASPSTSILAYSKKASSNIFDKFSQLILDGAINCQPRVPTFTSEGLMDYMVQLVVCEDKVRYGFSFVGYPTDLDGLVWSGLTTR